MALISFDLDGVVQRNPFRSDRPDGVFGRIQQALAPHMPETDPAEAGRAVMRLIMNEYTGRLMADRLVEAHDWDDVVRTVADQLGVTVQVDVAAWVAECCEIPGLAYLYGGAADCMDRLRADGHTLVSITNGFRSYQEPTLRFLGVLDRFTALITPEAVGAAKPKTGIFRAAEAFGSPCLHIGDTLPHDIAGATRAGWRSIYVVQPGAPGATPLPADLAALPPWERPAHGREWLAFRLERERRWYPYPPASLEECIPSAIVHHLQEIPESIPKIMA